MEPLPPWNEVPYVAPQCQEARYGTTTGVVWEKAKLNDNWGKLKNMGARTKKTQNPRKLCEEFS